LSNGLGGPNLLLFLFLTSHPWNYFVHPAMRIDSFAPWLIDLLTATIEVDPCNCFISPLFQLCFFILSSGKTNPWSVSFLSFVSSQQQPKL
jgi:hypothetical protein